MKRPKISYLTKKKEKYIYHFLLHLFFLTTATLCLACAEQTFPANCIGLSIMVETNNKKG